MWLNRDSLTDWPVLIEIETPQKKWFTKAGQPTKELTQARDQITEWRTWFSNPNNLAAFKRFYRLPEGIIYDCRVRPTYLLVYGRRAEANRTEELEAKRGHLAPDDEFLMTFDRLTPNRVLDQVLCVKIDAEGFRAVSVPATLQWWPHLAEARAAIRGKDAAIVGNQYVSTRRKRFLLRRMAYWDQWAQGDMGTIRMGDAE